MSDEYMLPGEFIALAIFLFAPPLIIAMICQTIFYRKKGIILNSNKAHLAIGCILTTISSLGVGGGIFAIAPRLLAPILRVRDASLGPLDFPIMPLTFLAVALTAPVVAWWTYNKMMHNQEDAPGRNAAR